MNKLNTGSTLTAAAILLLILGGVFAYVRTSSDTAENTDADGTSASQSPEETGAPQATGGDREQAVLSANWAENVDIRIEDGTVFFESDGLPAHEILDQYLGDGRDGKFISDSPVIASNTSYSFPLTPTMIDSPADTPFGSIGVSVSGAVFFNPFEGDGSGVVANDDNTVIDGIPFIDSCGGHPLPDGTTYHYHGIPFCVTDAQDTEGQHSEVVGFMFDGVPVYGPQDVDGNEPTDLDTCLGHTGPAPGYSEDVYHYHVTSSANYISECFFAEAASTRGAGPGPR